jgi:hypothetical protein
MAVFVLAGAARAADFTCDNLTVKASQKQSTNSTASGSWSTAEGWYTTAAGNYSHAEGVLSQAQGTMSHAQGYGTYAAGAMSHAGGSFAAVLSEHTNAFIHATGVSTNLKQTLFSDTGHFDKLCLLTGANDHSNSVLARWEADNRYPRLTYLAAQGDLAMGIYTNGP